MSILLSETTPEQKIKPERTGYPALSGLRFFAASVIFVFHNQDLIPAAVPEIIRNLVAEFHIGVSVFFVLSGFLIANQLAYSEPGNFKAYCKFLATRFARIYPLYWIVILVLQFQVLYTIPEFIIHAALLKGYFKNLHPGVVQDWSLTVELAFYACAPLIHKAITSGRTALAFFAVSLTGILLWGVGNFFSSLGLNTFGFLTDLKLVAFGTFFGRASEFFVGMLLFHKVIQVKKDIPAKGFPVTYGAIILLTIACLLLNLFQQDGEASVQSWGGILLHHTVMPLIIGVLIVGLIREKTMLSSFLSARFLILLGNASFVFYLIHLGWVNNFLFHHLTQSPVLLFVLLWVISIAVYLVLDKPLYKWCRNRIAAF